MGITHKRFDIEFEPELPESVLGHKPLYMLMQVLDSSHVRVGFRADKGDPWHLSKPFDVTKIFGERIGKIDPYMCFWGGVSKEKDGEALGVGNIPRYPRFLIDYVHFRKGLSTPK